MISKISKLLVNLFGSRNERIVKSYMQTALAANEFESKFETQSDDELRGNTVRFKEMISGGADPAGMLPEVFEVVREAAKRNMQMRHYDVQLIGGNVLFDGKIAEMATGEGKTLMATLAAYLVHITGKHVHVITVNDYLAKRDAEWMRPVYEALGMSVGAIQASMNPSSDERKSQYSCDITYGTNNEFGFDYLRDNMKLSIEQCAQGPLDFAIIDEVDSILIDEARTPLIISGPAFDDVTRYKKAKGVVQDLLKLQGNYDNVKKRIDDAQREVANAKGELAEAKKDKDDARGQKAQSVIDKSESDKLSAESQLEDCTQYFEVEYDRKAVHLTDEGVSSAQDIAGVGSFFTGSNMDWPHLLEQSLRAHVCFEREKDYVVLDGKIVIVDEFTGRLMEGRQWSDGLHQAIEAKENVEVKEETQTLATITFQNFFRLYGQLSGMTGTAITEAQEFLDIYKLDVVAIPTNRPCARDDREDVIYKSLREKFEAIVEEVKNVSCEGKPVLVGTVSIESSEAISNVLTRKYGIEHEVLNAKQHSREASIVEKAGQQHAARDGEMRGNVTIATNMAGRGTDIKLGDGVAELGGLHILGTERHESRRIDNQLRGRAGRQGDNGSSQFFLSFDDDLLRIFSPEWTIKALTRTGWEEGEPIYHKWITRGIEKAQKKVEERNFESRKSLLDYDEVMDYQRKTFYGRRHDIIKGVGLRSIIEEMIRNVVEDACGTILDEQYPYRCICEWLKANFGVDVTPKNIYDLTAQEIDYFAKERARKEVASEISLSLGEYLEDYEDRSTWKLDSLSKWVMSTYKASLSVSKLREMSVEEIEELVVGAACDQVDKRDSSMLDEFLREDFARKTFVDAMKAKFAIDISIDEIQINDIVGAKSKISELIDEKFAQREVEYAVDFAMNMVYTPQGTNVYGFEALAKWANKKYESNLDAENLQTLSPKEVHEKLLSLSSDWSSKKLQAKIDANFESYGRDSFVNWANERFDCGIDISQLTENDSVLEMVSQSAHEFMRSELSQLERYVLLQIYDSSWKDHLYAMDHMRDSIFLRSFAEKDPKLEYKQEGYRMFDEMLLGVEQKVTDTIFKVHLEAGVKSRSVWNVTEASHENSSQFADAERQRAAAMAPQGEKKVRQIQLATPKVGRNDPCPCGSGKKYKKCCGKA